MSMSRSDEFQRMLNKRHCRRGGASLLPQASCSSHCLSDTCWQQSLTGRRSLQTRCFSSTGSPVKMETCLLCYTGRPVFLRKRHETKLPVYLIARFNNTVKRSNLFRGRAVESSIYTLEPNISFNRKKKKKQLLLVQRIGNRGSENDLTGISSGFEVNRNSKSVSVRKKKTHC